MVECRGTAGSPVDKGLTPASLSPSLVGAVRGRALGKAVGETGVKMTVCREGLCTRC